MMNHPNGPNQMRLDPAHVEPKPSRHRLALGLTLLGLISLAGTGVGMGLYHVSNTLIWDRFDTVKPGVLYRSGQLSEGQLREAIKRYGIRTVVNFQVKDKSVEQESAIAKELGISFLNLPMPGDGFGQEEQFREVLKAVDNPDQRPLLIHCARGTCRTGAAVALYRFERDGWSIDDVSDEMLRQSYKPGWLSGYIYGMLDRTPNMEFRDPVEKAQALSVQNVPKAVVGQKEPVSPEVRR